MLADRSISTGSQELIELVDELLDLLGRKCRRVDGVFDEKLADYTFFPLAQLLHKKQSFSDHLTESTIKCLTILLENGWRARISPGLGKQLLMLLTIVIGGVPGVNQTVQPTEELVTESFRALTALFKDLKNTPLGSTTLLETATIPVLGHCVSIILDGITDGPSADVQQQALEALDAAWKCIRDPETLSSFLPGTVSALTKCLTPSTASRRLRKTLILALRVLECVLVSMLGDVQTKAYSASNKEIDSALDHKEQQPLTASWLKATTAQIKLALSNVMGLRSHEASDVRSALDHLCLVLVDECHDTLSAAMPILIETAMILIPTDAEGEAARTHVDLRHLAIIYPEIGQLIKMTIYNWIKSLPRVMQGNDEISKQNLLRHISGNFELVTSLNLDSSVLGEALADSIREGVIVSLKTISLGSIVEDAALDTDSRILTRLRGDVPADVEFEPIVMTKESERQTRMEFIKLLSKFERETQLGMAVRMLDYIRDGSGPDLLSAFWLCSRLMRAISTSSEALDEFIDSYPLSSDNEEFLNQELFSYSVQIISNPEATNIDWRLQAIALEIVADGAKRSKVDFRAELVDVLFPVAQLLGSPYPDVRDHAIKCLNIISFWCGYRSTSELIIENSDYMLNSIALKLNSFNMSPQAPQVLKMLIRLTGPSLLLYFGDVMESIFAALDNFHGYHRLVDALFSVLGEVVQTGSKSNLIDSQANQAVEDRARSLIQPEIRDIVDIICKRESRTITEQFVPEGDTQNMMWEEEKPLLDERDALAENKEEGLQDSSGGEIQKPPPSKVYSMLESIARLSQHYLTNTSPLLRSKLLYLISTSCDSLQVNDDRFLPLVNDIWPVVIKRVYDEEGFVAIAGADAVAEICKCAGDFMSTRIQVEWPDLIKLASRSKLSMLMEKDARSRGRYSQHHQVWDSIVRLIISIARHVRISDDIFDEILDLLGFLLCTRSDIKDALSSSNADAVWLSMYCLGQTPEMEHPALGEYPFMEV